MDAPMRLFFLVALTMIAFAANSVLNRLGLVGGDTDPLSFAVLRLVSGALALAALVWLGRGQLSLGGAKRLFGAASLVVYMLGFSLAQAPDAFWDQELDLFELA